MKESQIQSECVKWLWNTYPETRGLFFAVTNNSENIGRAMVRRSVGLIAGVSDCIFVWRNMVYFIEFKTDIGVQSHTQIAFENRVVKEGFKYFIVRSVDQFKTLISNVL